MAVHSADLDGFIRDLFEGEQEIDVTAFRRILARHRLEVVSIEDLRKDDRGEAQLWARLRRSVQRVRIGSGPLVDAVILDDIEDPE